MTPLGLLAYRAASALASPAAPALLRVRARRGKEDLLRVGERLGFPGRPRPDGTLAWLHGASVGESLSLLPLIVELRRRRPDLQVLVTTGTTTAAALLAARLPNGAFHQYVPIDGPLETARFLDAWRPAVGVFVESEIWPNLLTGARARGVKLALLSARLSEGSLQKWRRAPGSARRLFGAFSLVMAQDAETAARLKALGARSDGLLNLKRYMIPLPVDEALRAQVLARAKGTPVFLAASTHEGEEDVVLSAFRLADADASLVIAPRHPDRGDRIEALALREGFDVRRRSRGEPFEPGKVFLADTLGELGAWFSLAGAALIGGSLVAGPGGHNPLEAAQLGCPVVSGPYVANWRRVYDELYAAEAALRVSDAKDLARVIQAMVENDADLRAGALRALAVAQGGGDRLEDAVDQIEALLGMLSAAR